MTSAYDIYTFFLSPDDLQGKAVPVTVERATVVDVFNNQTKRKEPGVVIFFVGKKLGLICSKTRAGQMINIAGTDVIEQWAGTKVILVEGKAQNGKRTIEIKAPGAGAPATQHAQPPVRRPANPAPAKRPAWQEGKDAIEKILAEADKKPVSMFDQIQGLLDDLATDRTKEAYALAVKTLGYAEDFASVILGECENDYRTAAERLLEQEAATFMAISGNSR